GRHHGPDPGGLDALALAAGVAERLVDGVAEEVLGAPVVELAELRAADAHDGDLVPELERHAIPPRDDASSRRASYSVALRRLAPASGPRRDAFSPLASAVVRRRRRAVAQGERIRLARGVRRRPCSRPPPLPSPCSGLRAPSAPSPS